MKLLNGKRGGKRVQRMDIGLLVVGGIMLGSVVSVGIMMIISHPTAMSPEAPKKNKSVYNLHEVVLGNRPDLESLLDPNHVLDQIGVTVPNPHWTPPGPGRYSEYKDGTNIFVPTPEILTESDNKARLRRNAIRDTMKHAWSGYKKYAWGRDELKPQTKGGMDNWGGMGITLVDSLDTLWLMGMKEEFWEARDWVRDYLDHEHVGRVSVFETTIRSLGGLLSAYDWSRDEVFLNKALDLGKRLGRAFETFDTGIPSNTVVLGATKESLRRGTDTNIAEVGTLQLEFLYLKKVTGYDAKSERVYTSLQKLQHQFNGLFPQFITANNPVKLMGEWISFGGMGDSFYEYMLKLWLQSGKKEKIYRDMYDYAMDGMHEQLLQKSEEEGLTYIAEKKGPKLAHQMEHLVCFMAGSLALGAYTHPDGLESPKAQRDLKTGKALAYTCYQSYASQKSGIGPEVIYFLNGKKMVNGEKSEYKLRPETLESFYILNKLTGDPIYREWGWEIYQSIERFCKTDAAYGQLEHVDTDFHTPNDKMESFFLGETLKYMYLLMDPDNEVDILNKHVFNTEAHPLRRFDIMSNQ